MKLWFVRSGRETFAAFMILTGLIIATGRLTACTVAPKSIEAAGAYEAQQAECVQANSDRASIDACRAKVKAAWTVDAGADASDSGKDASK